MSLIYTFRGNLVLTGALHIGSGSGNEQTDAAIVRDAQGRPYLPGSSLRGAFRAAVERLAPTLLGPNNTQIREDFEEMQRIQEASEKALEKAREDAQSTGESFDTERAMQMQLDARLSAAERLFGTVLWASPLTIPDLPLLAEDPASTQGEIRHGVGIDRDTGAAREQVKYDFEVLPRGSTFRFLMRCEMEHRYQAVWERLLAIGLRLLEMGELPLGGRLARGVGQVRLDHLEVFQLDLHNRDALKRMLVGADDDARYGSCLPDGSGWVRTQLEGV
ncbi:MAG: hypothetical protein HC884_05985 [Chloroflexaceae bacterium]|nr:hypothetical protein [Chloroflexaceae bacterium]